MVRVDGPRMPRGAGLLPALCCVAFFSAGCGGGPASMGEVAPAPAPETGAPPATSARTLPIPGEGPARKTGSGRLHWKVPEHWEEVRPSSTMRLAQYRIAGTAGDGECVVFYFGPGQGGDPMANAARWAGQFEQPGGGSSLEAMRVTDVEGGGVPIRLVEVTGTYDGGMTMTAAPPERKPGYMLLGGIAQGPDAPWFFKFTGPEATLRAERDAFVGLLRSIHPD